MAFDLTEQINLAGLRVLAALRQAWRSLAQPVLRLLTIRAHQPARLLIAPQDIRTADATVAEDIYAGYFSFGSKAINTHGRSPFTILSPSPEWETALMSFGWLRDLRAASTPLAMANARALVDEWINLCGSPSRALAWDPEVAALRLQAWLSHSPLILEGADLRFYRRFMKSIGRHVAFLRRELSGGLDGAVRLKAAVALMTASLCAEGMGGLHRRATRALTAEINRQILLDGGHASRNPQAVLDFLLDFLPLRQAFVARNLQAPKELVQAVDRMLPMLRLFRHADGALALFNGMGVTHQGALLTALSHDDARARPIMHAIASGYQRIEAGPLVLISDMGKPPAGALSIAAHAGTLAFEFSADGERIVVNCGAPAARHGSQRAASRLTAAHSTLVLGDASSSRFAGESGFDRWLGGRLLSGPRRVSCERFETEAGVAIEGAHDGYAGLFGLRHERGLAVNIDGSAIAGRDRLARAGRGSVEVDFAIRFHLHPQIWCDRSEDGAGALLVTPNGRHWIFRTGGPAVEIEESVFFASPDGPRATRQLVIYGRAEPGLEVDWFFEREA